MDLKNFSFAKALKTATKASRWEDKVTILDKNQYNKSLKQSRQPQLTFIELKHQLWNMFQFQDFLFYFFSSVTTSHSSKQPQFDLTCWSFMQKNGQNNNFEMKGFKGTPTCIASGLAAYLKQGGNIKNTEKVQNNYIYKMAALVGVQEGFLKVIQMQSIQRSGKLQIKHTLYSQKIEEKPIVCIKVADKLLYEQKNICFILMEDSKVMVYNYVSHLIICTYKPPILSHDHAIILTLHASARYFATCTKGGQIFFWELSKSVLEAIAHSQDKQIKQRKKKTMFQTEQLQDQVDEVVWKFKSKDRIMYVIPQTTVHAASVDGLKWIGFMGNLLAIISAKGVFKLIAISFQVRDEYIIVMQHEIEDGASISTAQIFPEAESLIYFKSCTYIGEKSSAQVTDHITQQESMTFQDLNQKEHLLKHDNFYKTNFKTLKQCRAVQNIAQELRFGEELYVNTITKYVPYEETVEMLGSKKNKVKRPIRFLSGSVSSEKSQTILMCRNDNGFYIGPMQ